MILSCHVLVPRTRLDNAEFPITDLWSNRPPYPSGVLTNYMTTVLADSESKIFLSENGKMARCFGRLKRDLTISAWLLHIINIRATDWEVIRWTKGVVSHRQIKMEAELKSFAETKIPGRDGNVR